MRTPSETSDPPRNSYHASEIKPVSTSMEVQFTAVFKEVPEGYIGFVEELPGANTQGRTLEEARANLEEAITLVLDANRILAKEGLRDEEVIREVIPLSTA